MKKIILISIFVLFFLIIFSRDTFAQTCNCVRRATPTLPVGEYQCVHENIYCPNGDLCRCEPLHSTDRTDPCNPGTCIGGLLECGDAQYPNTYCTYKCGSLSIMHSLSCPYAPQVCCEISNKAENDTSECINNCSTSCVFGISLPGFTCKVEIRGQAQSKVCVCYPPAQQPAAGDLYNICLGNPQCEACVSAGNSWTALGCITTSEPQEFVAWILKSAIGIAGGIAVLLIIFGGFLIILSSGDPQRLQTGKEILTSAIIGLLVIIFSMFLLQIIGVEILQIPGFG